MKARSAAARGWLQRLVGLSQHSLHLLSYCRRVASHIHDCPNKNHLIIYLVVDCIWKPIREETIKDIEVDRVDSSVK